MSYSSFGRSNRSVMFWEIESVRHVRLSGGAWVQQYAPCVEPQRLGRPRRAFGLTVLAFGWGIALVGAALLVPVYSSETASPPFGATTASTSLTLVQVNGLRVLIPVGVPALVAALVWIALHRKCSRGGRASGYLAWSLIWMLFAFCLVAIASIGWFVVPVAGLLARAASLTPSGARPRVSV
jgi:hypothetical protein